MSKLKSLQANIPVRGILVITPLSVVSIKWFSLEALEVACEILTPQAIIISNVVTVNRLLDYWSGKWEFDILPTKLAWLGQEGFKVAITDAYGRAYTTAGEHSLRALEAAHIKPNGDSRPHAVYNGLLLRSDVHRLFDRGYIAVTLDYYIEVSSSLKEEFKNGRYYYPFHGRKLHHLPINSADYPAKDVLIWHNENIFRS